MMRERSGMSAVQIVVIVVVSVVAFMALAALGLSILVPSLGRAHEMANRGVCMANLASINKGLILYKSYNDNKYPWINSRITSWDTAAVGTSRNVDPNQENPDLPAPRSVTALMFMLVRDGQAPGIFRCPSDRESVVDDNVRAGQRDGDAKEGEFYWDFSKPENVSYSWQAPRYINGQSYDQGIDGSETEMIVTGDMTPRYEGDGPWTPVPIDDNTPQADIQRQMSQNHRGQQVNVLKVAGNVKGEKRPDVGISKDNIYTAYGTDFKIRRTATSTNIADHRKSKDTFLIGPVGRAE